MLRKREKRTLQLHHEIETTTAKIEKETETTRFNTAQIYCHVLGADAAEVTAEASTAIPTQLD